MTREVRVGLLVLAALVVLGIGIFLVGERGQLFTRSNNYTIRFPTVGGLSSGSPVQLNGFTVGRVEAVILPQQVEEQMLTVRISLDQRYDARVRQDSLARIKTLGLLGDKYVEITSGSAESAPIPDGGEIAAAPTADVDQLMQSGGDVVENIVAVSVSLRNLLRQMESGEGMLGLLTVDTPTGTATKESITATLKSLESITGRIERGEGSLGQLITRNELGDGLASSVRRLDAVLARFEEGDGLVPALFEDAELKDKTQKLVTDLDATLGRLSALAGRLERGEGMAGKLLTDEAYGQEVTADLRRLIRTLNEVADKLNEGEGTASRLINDPAVYEAVNDILVGVEESRLLRWLIRNRQKEGISKRYDEARESEPEGGQRP